MWFTIMVLGTVYSWALLSIVNLLSRALERRDQRGTTPERHSEKAERNSEKDRSEWNSEIENQFNREKKNRAQSPQF